MESEDRRTTTGHRLRRRPRARAAALIAYIDTSALVKLLVDEDGSDVADELWHAATLRVSCALTCPEARAAIAAAGRAGRLDHAGVTDAVDELERACGGIELVAVDWQLARVAGGLAAEHALRGYDAVHLACALAVEADDVVVVTWDADLARAARAAGRMTAPA